MIATPPSGFDGALPEVDVWVDALYGTGLTRAPSEAAQAMIERINASRAPVLSLDGAEGEAQQVGLEQQLGVARRPQHLEGDAVRLVLLLELDHLRADGRELLHQRRDLAGPQRELFEQLHAAATTPTS